MLLRQLFEALNDAQKKYVDDMMKRSDWSFDETRYDEIFGPGKTRIYLPMPEEAKPNATVIQALDQLGYTITDYRAGYAIAKEQKQYDIRRVLGKNPELLAAWEQTAGGYGDDSHDLMHQVWNVLNDMNYEIVDYGTGILTRENKPEAIGAILSRNKVDPSIINLFANDTYRTSATKDEPDSDHAEEMNTSNQVIVITRDKYEAAEVSTNKKWTSCLNLGGGWEGVDELSQGRGQNAHYLVQDVSIGCIAAYLVKKDDMELKDPIARLSIKPFINSADPTTVAFGVHDKVYHRTGRPYPAAFKTIVHQWANDINASKELDGLYVLHPDAYDYNEYEHDNKKQYHGNFKQDKKTHEEYGNNIQSVPEELRTFGYLQLVAENNPDLCSKIYQYCKSIPQVMAIARIGVNRGYGVITMVDFPDDLIDDNIDSYYDILKDAAESTSSILDQMYRRKPKLVEKLRVMDKKKFLDICETVLKKSYYVLPLEHIMEDTQNIELLSDLAQLKNLTSRHILLLVAKLISAAEHDTATDIIDALVSILRNSATLATSVIDITEYAEKIKNTELLKVIKNRKNIIEESMLELIKQAMSENEIYKIMNNILELENNGITVSDQIRVALLKNRFLSSDEVVSVLENIDDEKIIISYITDQLRSTRLLADIEDKFWGKPTIMKAINKKWLSLVQSMDSMFDYEALTEQCTNKKAIIALLNKGENIGTYATQNIANKLRVHDYIDTDALEIAINLLPHLTSSSYLNTLTEIATVLQEYSEYKHYKEFREEYKNTLLKQIEKDSTMFFTNRFSSLINYDDPELFDAYLNKLIKLDKLDAKAMEKMISKIHEDHNTTRRPLYEKLLPYFEDVVKKYPAEWETYITIYTYDYKPFNLLIIKNTKPSSILWERSEDDNDIKQAKLNRMIELVKDGTDENLQLFIKWLKEDEIPLEVQTVLLKFALEHDYIEMLNALYGSARARKIHTKLDAYFDKIYKYDTLDDALESIGRVDDWPFSSRELRYGEETAFVGQDGKHITVSRGQNGKYIAK